MNESIACQHAGKKRSSYIILKTARFLFLLFGFIVVSKLEVNVLLTKSQFYCV